MSDIYLLTEGEAAHRLRMLKTRLVRLAKAGEITCVVLPGGELQFDPSDIDAWIVARKQPSRSAQAT